MLVVLAGLFSIYLDPAELVGDRCALILVSALITVTNYQADLGLGKLQYLIWNDWFNLAQCGLLLVVLAETIWVHKLVVSGMTERASVVDWVFQRTVLFFLYPLLLTGLLLLGFDHAAAGGTIIALAVVVCVAGTALGVHTLERRRMRGRKLALRALGTGLTSPSADAIRTAFEFGDMDGKLLLDLQELRPLLKARLPSLSAESMMEAMIKARASIGEGAGLDLASFTELLDWAVRTYPDATRPTLADSRRSSKGSLGSFSGLEVRKV